MTIIQYINLSLQVWGCVLTAIIIACLLLSKRAGSRINNLNLYLELLIFDAGVMFFDAFALYFRGGDSILAYYGVRISNLLGFCCAVMVPAIFLHYLIHCFQNPKLIPRKLLHISRIICTGYVLLYLINVFCPIFYRIDDLNIYHRTSLYPLTFIPPFLNIGFSFYLLFRYKSQMSKTVHMVSIFYLLIPIPIFIVQMFVYGLNLVNFTGIIIIIIIFLFIQSEQSRKMVEQELALAEKNSALVLSQIQPHFLYNSLTAIYRLCDTNPEDAQKAINDFSKYLRGNLDSINQTKMISFHEELKHLQAYLSLEKIRFDDYLEIVYDIQATEFLLPPLTIQPLVENAIKHGIGSLPNGGRVTITTSASDQFYVICVQDNGIGFQPGTLPNDDRSHVGISSVRSRLEIMCSGSLKMISSPGNGTTAIIQIPK